jgi:thiol:disulfide interchange protein DsbD
MKKNLLYTSLLATLLVISGLNHLYAQFASPVNWKVSAQQGGGDTFEIRLNAKIPKGYHIYSHDIPADEGPVPTTITFNESADYKLVGKLSFQGKKISGYDPTFMMDLGKFKNEVTFIRKLVLLKKKVKVSGSYEYMVCDDKQCFPPELEEFTLNLSRAMGSDENTETISTNDLDASTSQEQGTVVDSAAANEHQFNWEKVNNDCVIAESDEADMGVWWVFILGFGGGLLALLTPCVFPMVPLTVSFFTKGGRNRREGVIQATQYGLSIIFIYVLLGVATTMIFGADALNAMSTSAFFNVLFFVIFIAFALSFFGLYEITLPSSWANQTDKLAGRGGIMGIFFMAFTLALVSFSCTGPIIGSLLVQAATGQGPEIGIFKIKPIMGMFGFSLALALPFSLFALFPQWLKTLPKSGGWMENIKVILGFLELALALKFLSVADLTQNWNFLRWELFMGLWVVIFTAMGVYAMGFLRKTHNPMLIRLFGIGSLIFAGWMAKATVTYTPVAILSGLAPPTHYNFFNNEVHELSEFRDFDEAVAFARSQNKPILIDFTGDGCVNCRKMEEQVWILPDIRKMMEKYVVVSLYVDNREPLPESEQYTSSITGKVKKIKTIGNKWTDFEIRHFQKASQPYYVLITPDMEVLTNPVAYTSENNFRKFLQCGLEQYKKLSAGL